MDFEISLNGFLRKFSNSKSVQNQFKISPILPSKYLHTYSVDRSIISWVCCCCTADLLIERETNSSFYTLYYSYVRWDSLTRSQLGGERDINCLRHRHPFSPQMKIVLQSRTRRCRCITNRGLSFPLQPNGFM